MRSQSHDSTEEEHVTLRGWVAAKRSLGGTAFILLRNGSGYIQLVAKRGSTKEEVFRKTRELSLESAIEAVGILRRDPRAPGGEEVVLQDIRAVARADKWPITKSAARAASFLYDKRHLSIRGRKAIAIIKIRAELVKAAFDFFYDKGFTYITAPTMMKIATEGGATLFALDYFGDQAYLTQSAQLYEEAAICAFEKVFIVQPAFRAEKSRTAKHLTEFMMIEAEQAFADQEDNMRLQEELVYFLCRKVVEKRSAELAALHRSFRPPEPPFPRITYDEACALAAAKGSKFRWGEDIPTEVERLISTSFEKPVFVTDYPLSARAFYHMTKPDDPKTTMSADLFVPEGFGEIATGGQRIHDHSLLAERIQKQELPSSSFQWYLDLRRYGMPPHSGFGLGVERTVRWICGLKHIRATSLFPRTTTRLSP